MIKSFLFITGVILLLIVFSFLGTSSGEEKISEIGMSPPENIEKAGYRIGLGDLLEIVTWKEPDFTLETLVRMDGKITFPLLNDLQASGLRPIELKEAIESRLKKFIEEPTVTVIVKQPARQKFYILGEVQNTGEYELSKGLTVLQAFALAGGFTEWSSKKSIILLRLVDGHEKIFRVNYKHIIKGKDFSQNIRLKANDTIIVP